MIVGCECLLQVGNGHTFNQVPFNQHDQRAVEIGRLSVLVVIAALIKGRLRR